MPQYADAGGRAYETFILYLATSLSDDDDAVDHAAKKDVGDLVFAAMRDRAEDPRYSDLSGAEIFAKYYDGSAPDVVVDRSKRNELRALFSSGVLFIMNPELYDRIDEGISLRQLETTWIRNRSNLTDDAAVRAVDKYGKYEGHQWTREGERQDREKIGSRVTPHDVIFEPMLGEEEEAVPEVEEGLLETSKRRAVELAEAAKRAARELATRVGLAGKAEAEPLVDPLTATFGEVEKGITVPPRGSPEPVPIKFTPAGPASLVRGREPTRTHPMRLRSKSTPPFRLEPGTLFPPTRPTRKTEKWSEEDPDLLFPPAFTFMLAKDLTENAIKPLRFFPPVADNMLPEGTVVVTGVSMFLMMLVGGDVAGLTSAGHAEGSVFRRRPGSTEVVALEGPEFIRRLTTQTDEQGVKATGSDELFTLYNIARSMFTTDSRLRKIDNLVHDPAFVYHGESLGPTSIDVIDEEGKGHSAIRHRLLLGKVTGTDATLKKSFDETMATLTF